MLKPEDNERLTRVGAGTPMGTLLRRYWQPVLLSKELPEKDGPPVRVRMLGEDLVAFRDTQDRIGLVDAYCPHRGAPMFYGRNEEHGIRCVYHGLKFDVNGQCTDLPCVAENARIRQNVRIKCYPTYESAGVVWTYMGPPEKQPARPDFEWMRAPATHRHVSKNYQANNYLQSLEGGLDTSHSSFLHNQTIGDNTAVRNIDGAPKIELFPTDYGYSYVSFRRFSDAARYIRVYQYIMPFQQLRGNILDEYGKRREVPIIEGHFWVPIDDTQTHTWNFMCGLDESVPLTPEYSEQREKRAGRGKDDFLPGTFKLKRNPSNDHMIDRELQKKTFTGLIGVATQDIGIQEGMAPIVDRSKEILFGSDAAILAMRRLLLDATRAVERGDDPPGLDPTQCRNVRGYDCIVPNEVNDWKSYMQERLGPKW
jgi:phenylpropionate dioxygenase-like ring-hydroxylating dioxygenase large terminal subunit